MATSKHTTPRPVTLDIDGFPGAGVYRTAHGEYWPLYLGQIVGGQMFSTAAEAEGPAIAAWVQAHPECQVTGEIVPDPETWQAVSAPACELCGEPAVLVGEQWTCPECSPIAEPTSAPAGAVSSVARVEIFDQLCQAADIARDYWRDVAPRVKVYNEAWGWILEQDAFWFDANGDLLYPSESEPGRVHAVGVSCSCTAGRWGSHCRHRAAADILGRARNIARYHKAA